MPWKKYTIIALLVVVLLIVAVASVRGNNKAINTKAKDCRLPRGLRNNNPGNIRYSSANDWRGKVPYSQNSDYNCTSGKEEKAFEQFSEYKYGVRAMVVLIKNYIIRGNDSIRSLVSKYAPSTENDTLGYIDFVSEKTGIGVDEKLSTTKRTIKKIVLAMAQKESGSNAISSSQFEQAWKMI